MLSILHIDSIKADVDRTERAKQAAQPAGRMQPAGQMQPAGRIGGLEKGWAWRGIIKHC